VKSLGNSGKVSPSTGSNSLGRKETVMAAGTAEQSQITTFLGMPMRWELHNLFKNLWNEDEPRIFPPRYFGIGWDLNLHALAKFLGLIVTDAKTKAKKKPKNDDA
jgi:hypothetical protein